MRTMLLTKERSLLQNERLKEKYNQSKKKVVEPSQNDLIYKTTPASKAQEMWERKKNVKARDLGSIL